MPAARKALIRYYLGERRFIEKLRPILPALWNFQSRVNFALKDRILFSLPPFYCSVGDNPKSVRLSYARAFWFVPGALRKSWAAGSAALIWEEYCH
jgi:hypothetical protein